MATVDIIIRTIDQSAQGQQSAISGLKKLASSYLTTAAVIGGFTKAIQFSISEAMQAQRVDAQLEAVLRSTGNAAGMTKDELEELATSLSKVSIYDDEAIKSTEALLLTFTKVGEQVFPEATQAIIDMSTAMGQDLKSSTIQIGKALNDPIKGITALQRVGVAFTEDQKKMIAAMVESGDVMGAQKIILQELSTEFGGSAAAAANTYEGQITQLKNEVGNLGETIGEDLLPDLVEFTKEVKESTEWVTGHYEEIKTWAYWLSHLQNPLLFASDALRDFEKSAETATRVGGRGGMARSLQDMSDALVDNTEKIRAADTARWDGIASLYGISSATDAAADSTEDYAAAAQEASEANQTFLSTLGNMQSEYESYSEEYTRISGDISLSDEERKLALQNLEAEHELATQKIVLGLLEQKLAMDGLTDEELNLLLEKGLAWGIYSEQVVTETRKAIAEANLLAETLNGLPTSKTFTYTMTVGGDVGVVMGNSTANQRVTRRAGGGGVNRGQPYMVGEQGTELFVPQQSGTIIPNNRLGSDDAIASMTDKIVSAIMMSRINEARFASLIKENALQVTK